MDLAVAYAAEASRNVFGEVCFVLKVVAVSPTERVR
jgi:hypothetical protein